MNNEISMQSRLDLLRQLIPPTGLVHVGAGTGTGASRYEHWDVATAVFIEAEESQFDRLNAAIGGRAGWSVHLAVLGSQQTETSYFIVNLSHESGLIPAEQLAGLWRNLKTAAIQLRQTTTLQRLLDENVNAADPLNWLVIDCLSAAPILIGSDLDRWDVILARVILDAEQCPGWGATKAEVDALLDPKGYRYVGCEEERHPSLGRVLYVRDRTSQVAQLHQQLGEAERLLAERRKELDQAEASEEKLASELQHKVAQLRQMRDDHAHLHREYREQVESLGHEKQALEKIGTDLQDQLAEQQRQTQYWREELNKHLDQLAEQQRQTQYWREEMDKRQQESEERSKRIEQLEQQLTEQSYRQRLLDEEILKSEAQIELIKDILLREKAF